MTDREKTALAMLSSGSSFKEASVLTGISVERLMELWNDTHKTAA
ncbi:hypothetical protein N185_00065 [Sinorhizobium sp. GW3]|nr:hypothetical protein N185_00065 [Sinorhizobium sp. GW3]